MIHATPALTDDEWAVIERSSESLVAVCLALDEPGPWSGVLGRATLARAVAGSTVIEGFHARVDDVVAVLGGHEPFGLGEATRRAVEGCCDAMRFASQVSRCPPDPPLEVSLLRSLHFLMLRTTPAADPGCWRPDGTVDDDPGGALVLREPRRDGLEVLVADVVAAANEVSVPPLARAAMAHLNLVLVHPFSEGNGRVVRGAHTYLLAAEGVLPVGFAGIEEELGRDAHGYHDALAQVGKGSGSPDRDARRWLRFCLRAHLRQARRLQRRVGDAEALWGRCEQLARAHRLPERCVGALWEAAHGWRLRRSLYAETVRMSAGEAIGDLAASRDLAAMVRAGLLEPVGSTRRRTYRPTGELAGVWQAVRSARAPRPAEDPYGLPGSEVSER